MTPDLDALAAQAEGPDMMVTEVSKGVLRSLIEAARREAALREALRDLWVASDSDASPSFLKEVRKDVDRLLHDNAGATAAVPLDALTVTQRDLADTVCFLDGHDRQSDRSACDGCEDFADAMVEALRARLSADEEGT